MENLVTANPSELLPKPSLDHIDIVAQYHEQIENSYRAMPELRRLGLVVISPKPDKEIWQSLFVPYQRCTTTYLMSYGMTEEAALTIINSLASCDLKSEARVLVVEPKKYCATYSFLTVHLSQTKPVAQYRRGHYAIGHSDTQN